MTDEKIKTILEAVDGLTNQEWESLKKYFDFKFSLNEKFENDSFGLAFETIKVFF